MVSQSIGHILVGISMCLSIAGAVPYVRDTLQGRTQPNRVTWSLWAAAPIIAAAASVAAGGDIWTALRTLIAGIAPLIVVFVSFLNSRAYWRLGPFDFGCGVLSIIALVAWLMTDSPRLAVLLAATADGVASLPTLRKAWRNPESETRVTFLFGLISNCILLPSIPVWNIENAAFPLYLLAINCSLSLAMYRGAWARAQNP